MSEVSISLSVMASRRFQSVNGYHSCCLIRKRQSLLTLAFDEKAIDVIYEKD